MVDPGTILNQENIAQQSVTKFLYAKTAGRLGLDKNAIKYPRNAITTTTSHATIDHTTINQSITEVVSMFT